MKSKGILFVCTGNICRSPTAEAVFRHYALEKGILDDFPVDSAGTHGYHIGEPPDSRAVAAALGRGIKMDDLRARRVCGEDFDNFSLVVAMDDGHHKILSRMMAGGAELRKFMEFAPEAGLAEVPDPYYGSERDFEYVLDLIESGVEGLLRHLQGAR